MPVITEEQHRENRKMREELVEKAGLSLTFEVRKQESTHHVNSRA